MLAFHIISWGRCTLTQPSSYYIVCGYTEANYLWDKETLFTYV